MDTNYLLFEDDNKIRQTIIDKQNRKKVLQIKEDEIKEWYDIEIKVLDEKQKILKRMYDDLRLKKRLKEKDVYESLS